MTTHSRTWKRAEQKIARLFGARRTPLSGSNSGHTAGDVIHDRLMIEVKYRASHALMTLWRKVNRQARTEGKTPVVALVEKHKPGALLVIHTDDLQAVLDQLPKPAVQRDAEILEYL